MGRFIPLRIITLAGCIAATLINAGAGNPPPSLASTLDFPLEDYVPAEFYRQDLSISPELNANLEDYSPNPFYLDARLVPYLYNQRNTSFSSQGRVSIHHDYLKYAQGSEYSGTSELDLNGTKNRNSTERISGQTLYAGDRSSGEGSNLYYRTMSNHAAKWYGRHGTSLGLLVEASISQQPWSRSTSRSQYIGVRDTSALVRVQTTFGSRSSRSRQFEINSRISAGIGRIYDVSFPGRIRFVLERLEARTGKKFHLDQQEMARLEVFMEARRQQRPFFDSRAVDIYEIECIDQFFRESSGVDNFSAGAVLDISDAWAYSKRQYRKSGWAVELFPYLKSRYSDYWSTSRWASYDDPLTLLDRENLNSESGLLYPVTGASQISRDGDSGFEGFTAYGLGGQILYERPYHNAFQISAALSSRIEQDWHEAGNEDWSSDSRFFGTVSGSQYTHYYLRYAYPAAEAALDLGLKCFPSTRSIFSISGGMNYRVQFDYSELHQDWDSDLFATSYQDVHRFVQYLNFEADYFISPPLSIQVKTGMYRLNDYARNGSLYPMSTRPSYTNLNQQDQILNYRLSGGLRYYLF